MSEFLKYAAAVALLCAPVASGAQTDLSSSPSFGYDLLGEFAYKQMEEEHLWGRYLWRQLDPSTYGNTRDEAISADIDPGAVTLTTPMPGVDIARELAAAYPPARRAEAERAFNAMLIEFGNIERMLDSPKGDVAAALATLVCAGITASTGRIVTLDHFKAVIAQFRVALANSVEFRRSSPEERRTLYERSVIYGMSLDSAYGRAKDAPREREKVKQQAQRLVQTIVAVDPSLLRLGPEGLRVAR